MNTQLKLDLPPGGGRRSWRDARSPLTRAGAQATYWAPVFVSLVLVMQILWLGLRPALAEARRLDAAELEVGAREEALVSFRQTLERDRRKLADDIWRERVRRSRRDPHRAPLTLAGSSSDS